MPRPECQKMYDEYVEAMHQWVNAASAAQSFASTDPIDPTHPQKLKPLPYYKEMEEVYQREEVARKG